MRTLLQISIVVLLLTTLFAQATGSAVAGKWEGRRHGRPFVTLEIDSHAGALGGSVVFYVLRDLGAGMVVAGEDRQEILHPRFEDHALLFQVRMGGKTFEFKMQRTGADEAQLWRVDDPDNSVRMIREK